MTKTKLLIFLCWMLISNSLLSQDFVNAENKWYVTDCCSNIFTGETTCETFEYEFGDAVMIGGVEYFELVTNNPYPLFTLGQDYFYRESEGRVYSRANENTDEFLQYDFTLEVGEEVLLEGDLGVSSTFEVISIDSIILNNGTERKRMTLAQVDQPDLTVDWIEGVGSLKSTFQTAYMFVFDCWVLLDCYFIEDDTEYEIGECMLTNTNPIGEATSISISPNPVHDRFTIDAELHNISSIELVDINGKISLNEKVITGNEVDVSHLANGFYIILVTLDSGVVVTKKFIKQ